MMKNDNRDHVLPNGGVPHTSHEQYTAQLTGILDIERDKRLQVDHRDPSEEQVPRISDVLHGGAHWSDTHVIRVEKRKQLRRIWDGNYL